jgi:hypothetical protein
VVQVHPGSVGTKMPTQPRRPAIPKRRAAPPRAKIREI